MQITELDFVKDEINGRSFWSVTPTSDYGKDCKTGRQLAMQVINYLNQENFTPIINWTLSQMIEKGEISGIEIGFFSTIAERLKYTT